MLTPPHPWLDRLAADPERAVDTLLRGVAHLPGLQRASPSEALMALLGDLPPAASEWPLIDRALLEWLKARRADADGLLGRPGGAERFIRETGEAFRAAWRLELPASSDWVRAELLDLLRWADGFGLDATFDLGRSVLVAAAHLQQGSELRFLWFRACEEAAIPRLRHRLPAALLGLARTNGGPAGGPSHDLIVGLARWAARLPDSDHSRGDAVREWRALKAAFPRQPGFWRGEWEAILDDPRIGAHPFTGWLKDADPALKAPANGRKAAPRAAPAEGYPRNHRRDEAEVPGGRAERETVAGDGRVAGPGGALCRCHRRELLPGHELHQHRQDRDGTGPWPSTRPDPPRTALVPVRRPCLERSRHRPRPSGPAGPGRGGAVGGGAPHPFKSGALQRPRPRLDRPRRARRGRGPAAQGRGP